MGRGKHLTGKMRVDEPKRILTHEETLELLSEMAQKGSVSAATALESALRRKAEAAPDDDLEDELAALAGRRNGT